MQSCHMTLKEGRAHTAETEVCISHQNRYEMAATLVIPLQNITLILEVYISHSYWRYVFHTPTGGMHFTLKQCSIKGKYSGAV